MCCHLHNYLLTRNSGYYIQRGDVDYENTTTGIIEEGVWRNENMQPTLQLQRNVRGSTGVEAKKTRDDFTEYFNSSEGSVPWQNN